MSTYNGEKYLREQIDSILNQQYKEITLLIRDDGSTDGTVNILKEYADKYANVIYYTGENLGVQKSFFHLMKKADEKVDYYAFSDQDDVWLPEKIKRAVGKIEIEEKRNKEIGNVYQSNKSTEKPFLYVSKTKLVNEQLEEIPVKIRKYTVVPNFGNALVENICTGCTAVFNKALLELVNRRTPEFTIMHDWWMYLVAVAFGTVVYDTEPGILYRQHKGNKVGMKGTWYGELQNRIRNFRKSNGTLEKQAAEFRKIYGTNYKNSHLTDWVADYKKNFSYRWRLVTSSKVYRQGKVDDLIFRGLFLLGMR